MKIKYIIIDLHTKKPVCGINHTKIFNNEKEANNYAKQMFILPKMYILIPIKLKLSDMKTILKM